MHVASSRIHNTHHTYTLVLRAVLKTLGSVLVYSLTALPFWIVDLLKKPLLGAHLSITATPL